MVKNAEMTEREATLEEYLAKALLLGMAYDPRDHTFNNYDEGYGDSPAGIYDADTMEPLDPRFYKKRHNMVVSGKLGPSWLRKMSYNDMEALWFSTGQTR